MWREEGIILIEYGLDQLHEIIDLLLLKNLERRDTSTFCHTLKLGDTRIVITALQSCLTRHHWTLDPSVG